MERTIKKSFIYSVVVFALIILGLTLFASFYTQKYPPVSKGPGWTADDQARLANQLKNTDRPITSLSKTERAELQATLAETDTPVILLPEQDKAQLVKALSGK